VPLTATNLPLTLISPALGTKLDTISFPMLTTFSLIRYACDRAFKDKRILDLHKNDCLYHNRQIDQSSTRNEQCDNSIISSFAFLILESVSTRRTSSVVKSACICRCISTKQEALEKHKRLVWTTERRKRETVFGTPRPNCHENEGLRDLASAHAWQY
jgi:hypothetical protein